MLLQRMPACLMEGPSPVSGEIIQLEMASLRVARGLPLAMGLRMRLDLCSCICFVCSGLVVDHWSQSVD